MCILSETTTIDTESNGTPEGGATPPSVERVRRWLEGGTKEKVGGSERREGEVGVPGGERSRKEVPEAPRGWRVNCGECGE